MVKTSCAPESPGALGKSSGTEAIAIPSLAHASRSPSLHAFERSVIARRPYPADLASSFGAPSPRRYIAPSISHAFASPPSHAASRSTTRDEEHAEAASPRSTATRIKNGRRAKPRARSPAERRPRLPVKKAHSRPFSSSIAG